MLVLCVQDDVLKQGDGKAKDDAVGGIQIIECLHYAARADAGRLDVAGLVDASGDQDRVMTLAQLVHGGVAADFEILMKDDAPLRQAIDATLDDMLFQLEARDAIGPQAAHTVVPVVDMQDRKSVV